MKLGLQTFVGLAVGILCIVSSIFAAGEAHLFWNLPSFLITIGATTGTLIISFPMKRLKTIGSVIKTSFKKDEYDLRRDIEIIVRISEIARREGFLALEKHIDELTDDEFLKKGVDLLMDGNSRKMIKFAMTTDIHATERRHKEGCAMIEMIAATTPALGLLGTYVGLIPMLQSLNDPESLGPLMAVELVSSFYGGFVAYLIFAPMAKRLRMISNEEIVRKKMVLEGLLALAEGVNPRMIQENLMSYLTKHEAKKKISTKSGGSDGQPETQENSSRRR